MGEFEAKTVNVYGNKIYVCIKSSKIPGSCNSGFQIEWNYKENQPDKKIIISSYKWEKRTTYY